MLRFELTSVSFPVGKWILLVHSGGQNLNNLIFEIYTK